MPTATSLGLLGHAASELPASCRIEKDCYSPRGYGPDKYVVCELPTQHKLALQSRDIVDNAHATSKHLQKNVGQLLASSKQGPCNANAASTLAASDKRFRDSPSRDQRLLVLNNSME